MITTDFLSVIYAYGIFLLVYVANILFSLYLNIEVLNQSFDRYKFGQSVKKGIVFVLATLMLVAAIDTTSYYLSAYIPELTEELQGVVTVVAVITTIGRACIKYLTEAYATFKNILEMAPLVKSEGRHDD